MQIFDHLHQFIPTSGSTEKTGKRLLKLPTDEDKAIEDIKWINAFYREHGREPIFDRNNMIEYSLCEKLQRLRYNYDHFPILKEFDTYNLLVSKPDNSPYIRKPV